MMELYTMMKQGKDELKNVTSQHHITNKNTINKKDRCKNNGFDGITVRTCISLMEPRYPCFENQDQVVIQV